MPDGARATDPLFDVAGKAIVVTGAAGGLGRAIAEALADRGARLLIADQDATSLEKVHSDLAGECRMMPVDVTDERGVDALMAYGIRQLGRIDGLVNAVGIYDCTPTLELEPTLFQKVMDVNVTGALLLSRAAARAMGETGGRIVHLASVSSYVANINYAAYATSKAALAQLVRVLAREWAPRGINVNGIGPAMTETNLSRPYLADPKYKAQAMAVIPLGRLGAPADLIGTVILLLSPGGSFITGQIIYVDGGRTLV
jgi:NAD(P)-dependent dehydrogenase (short-subunit alcohol dehydrogenase family)